MAYLIKPGLSVQPTGDESIILDKNNHQIHQLNQVATFIWNALSQGQDEIPLLVSQHFHVDISIARHDYEHLISELLEKNLISHISC
jgi:hypothetical protein